MTLRDDILAVMRDGSRIDRYLEITCVDDPPCEMFLTTQASGRVQFEVPASVDATADDEEASADAIIEQARDYLTANS